MNGRITGLGSYAPARRLTNSDLEKMVNTSDEWIFSRSGIRERRICSSDETNSDMAVAAARKALDMARLRPEDIELILVGTVTPDYRLPSNACIMQKKMGMFNAAAIDIAAACAAFINGLSIANAFIKSGQYKRVLVVGVEKLSSITDYTDRSTCVLFGDGAGAVVLEACDDDRGVLSTFLKSDGRYAELLWIPHGGSMNPVLAPDSDRCSVYLKMNGSEVFKHAVKMMGDASLKALASAGLTGDDVTLMVPHQANIRIIEATAKRLRVPMERVFLNIAMYGNTSSASVPMAMDAALRAGRIKDGDIILMAAFGGGLTWASAVVRW
ncbi:MAG: ketoacyl-ACP synthase III [candidate division Zixibacteria bacterium]|nr:ketoacyl-ACP synthase III [candidate division Zixibacteria bacterium]